MSWQDLLIICFRSGTSFIGAVKLQDLGRCSDLGFHLRVAISPDPKIYDHSCINKEDQSWELTPIGKMRYVQPFSALEPVSSYCSISLLNNVLPRFLW